jgi:hypothetical protein
MKEYGFLPFPIMVRRLPGMKLIIIDGQHRYLVAKELGLPLYYVETDRDDVIISKCAAGQSAWNVFDYVASWAARGKKDYEELVAFQVEHKLPLATCAAILYGHTAGSGTNTVAAIKAGTFTIRDRRGANRVGRMVGELRKLASWAADRSSVTALSRFLHVKEFDEEQLISKAQTYPHLLVKKPTKELYAEMYTELYNHASRHKIPLDFLANEAAARRGLPALNKERAELKRRGIIMA